LWFDSLRAFHTTDKRPASHLVSRFYRTDYNAPEYYGYHRLAVLVLLPSLPSLDPLFIRSCGQAFRSGFKYSIVKVLFVCVSSFIIQQKDKLRYIKN